MARTKRKDQQTAEILERQYQALELRRRGLSYRKIGEKLGVSYVQARTDVESMLRQLATENHDMAEENRQLELERLDAIYDGLDKWVAVGNPNAVNAYIRAMERRAKLLGLDAPVHVILKVEPDLLKRLQATADASGVDLAQVFESMINEFSHISAADSEE